MSFYRSTIDFSQASNAVLGDPRIPANQKRELLRVLHGGAAQSQDPLKGLLTTGDVVRGAVGAGVGSVAAKYLGTVFGGVFGGLKPSTLEKVQNAGALAGMLRGTGVWR